MKKEIIFMLINMNIGGTEKALLNMIAELPEDQFEITILMLEENGGFFDQIPSNVKVDYLKDYHDIKPLLNNPPKSTFVRLLKKGRVIKAFRFFTSYSISKGLKNKSIFFNYLLRNHSKFKKEYDIAVAYAGPMDFISYFVLNKIKSKKKVQWIHFDITQVGFDKHFASKAYKKFDKIFTVSKEGLDKLLHVLPSIKEKSAYLYNLTSSEYVMKMADYGLGFQDHFNGIRVLTVGRLSKEKGQDLAIPVLAKLKSEGYNLKWYCVGEGSARVEYEKLIEQYKVKNEFILLGSNPNPYPFMNECDIYVQPSRHEGYCITLAEARYFEKPIVSTNFNSVREHIKDGETGLIVEINEGCIYKALKKLLDNKELRDLFIENSSKEYLNFSNEKQKVIKNLSI
ncbi:glycosyltransferase [Alteribacter populi]|uniref:glycosyltransferase n=1 Tax=Alteribacter populi TaxID=2011011 RepID=UPI000BBB0C12|nr:glycosyltransferase [Alteribacter populi]